MTASQAASQPRCHIIVGGTAGMGFAAARELVGAGDRVAIIGRDPVRAQEVAARLAASHDGRAIGDGSDAEGVAAAIARCTARLGRVDGLAVTAGPIHSRGDVLTLSDEDWAESFETQLMTVVRSIRAVLPAMIAQGQGAIVTLAAYSIRSPKPVLTHYAAMKAAVATLTKSIAKSYGGEGVRANCIAPGAIATEALDGARQAAASAGAGDDHAALWQVMRDQWGQKAALDRIGEPQEVGELIAFLLSSRAHYLTGALINIDGGTDF
jgi:NAD(P)-dependent dehydrogenase (short-subunit alcohol dehydrogenase family)